MLGLFLIWFGFLVGYICNVIWPTNLNNCSKNIIDKENIDDNSKLNFIYINKGAFPKLKIIAYETIIHFSTNILLTILLIILYFKGIDSKILNLISLVYCFIFFETITIIVLNLIR